MSVDICQFFLEQGYCTLGTQCNSYHARTQKEADLYLKKVDERNDVDNEKEEEKSPKKVYSDVTEICFSFDTTGSMSSYLETVRDSLKEIVKDLFAKVPNIRISIIAHGDYCDEEHFYVIKYIDFTRDQKKLLKFVKTAGATGGGDAPECYELALHYAASKLKWTPNARSKAVVIIGDAEPHEPDYRLNKKNLDWRKETDRLRMQEVTIYGVYCGHGSREKKFYQSIANKTGGQCLQLTNVMHICKLFVALCLKTSDDTALFEQYKAEILRSSAGDDELSKALQSLSGMQKEAKKSGFKVDSAVKRLMYDLKEIQREQLIEVAVVPEDTDVFQWHVNLKPIQGLFKDVYIHLTLKFPANYPAQPPAVKLVTKIPNDIHPNIEDNNVCLPLFGASNSTSKFGSSWSAAYSIISLLVNISSIFTEIQLISKATARAKHTVKKSIANKILAKIRNTNCTKCGHSHNTPYPVLGINKLPFDMAEINVNEQYFKQSLQDAVKAKDKQFQQVIVEQQRSERKRGALIAGNIIETVKIGKFFKVQSLQGINRNYHKTVSWQFTVDMFEKKTKNNSLASDFIFGIVNDKDNQFFGVAANGHTVYDNKMSDNKVYDHHIKQQTVMSYILNFCNWNEDQMVDELYVFINYELIATISIPALYGKCEIFYPVMYVKDIRLHLNLNIDPRFNDVVKRKNKHKQLTFDAVEAFNKLQSNYMINTKDTLETSGTYYKDQQSWNELLIKALGQDVLLTIFRMCTYCDLVRCKEVNTHWYQVCSGHNVVDRLEMRCFYTHESIEDKHSKCILGVGLNVTKSSNKWISGVETEMDLLSLSAYKDYNIYKGCWGERITHFLPLVINDKHSKRARKAIVKRIAMICDEDKFNPRDALMAITAIMNSFVVQLFANTVGFDHDDEHQSAKSGQHKIDPKHASEKALIGYCAFHHLLLWLVEQYPSIQKEARDRLRKFIQSDAYRNKSETPDLGKFILNLSIVDDIEWKDIASEFVHEGLTRQVKWYLQKYPELKNLDKTRVSEKQRIALTVQSTKISRRLVMFQVFFLQNICKVDGYSMQDLLANYNKRWGRPTKQQKNMLMRAVKQILMKEDTQNSWLEYFQTLGVKQYTKNSQVCNALKRAVIASKDKEYHREYNNHRNNKKQNKSRKRNNTRSSAPYRHYDRYSPPPAVVPEYRMEDAADLGLDIGDQEIIEMQGELIGHRDEITSIHIDISNPDIIMTGSRDKSVVVWEVKDESIGSVALSRNIRIKKGKMVKRLNKHNHFVSDIDVSSDGQYVLTACWDNLCRLFNVKTGRMCRKFIAHTKDVLGVTFSPDNRKIISVGMDKSICLWNTVGVLKQEIKNAHRSWITKVAVSPDVEQDLFVTCSVDKSVKVWAYNEESQAYGIKHELIGHKSEVTALTISPDGSLCASGDKLGILRLWDINAGKMLADHDTGTTSNQQIHCIVFSPNRYWACIAVGPNIQIIDLETKNIVGTLKTAQTQISEINPNRRKHYSSTRDNCTCMAWSADGSVLYAGYADHKVRVWTLIKT